MGIGASVISVVLKSLVGNKVGTGLIKELVDISIGEVSEKSISKINDFINGEKSKIENILSKENMKSMNIPEENIDFVVAEVKDLLSRISITEKVLRHCRYDNEILRGFLVLEYWKYKDSYIECESDIAKVLLAVAEALIKLLRESESFEKDFLIQISNSVDDINVDIHKIFNYMEDNFGKLDADNQIMLNILLMILGQVQKMNMQGNEIKSIADEEKKFENNKKQDYIINWNSRLFLHVDNDENPITLADAFIMPDFEMYRAIQGIDDPFFGTLDNIIEEFIEYEKNSTMLITGVPGIGKSSMTSWIANKYKDDARVIVLRFRDWEREELENGLLKAICNTLECKNKDLKHKILVLDGFDEMKALDIRDRLLNRFFYDIKDRSNFKCIITSRPAYIDSSHFQTVINLKEFSINKVDTFYKKIKGSSLTGKEKIESNLEVLGIPVILYMAIMSDVDFDEKYTKPELYNKIFAKEGGIFDRFYDGENEYSDGSQIMRDTENIKKYLKFLREVAFIMFENNRPNLKIEDCKVPELVSQEDTVSILEFPIKHLFEDVKTNIEFIHKSIYEYFVSEYIYTLMYDGIIKNASIEGLAGIFGDILKGNRLTKEIIEFLKYRITNGKMNTEFEIINNAFSLMLQDGMTYHVGECYQNVIHYEMNVFVNMLELLHLWSDECHLVFGNLFCNYLRYNKYPGLNLKGIKFRMNKDKTKNGMLDLTKGVYLEEVYLAAADLSDADLSKADLLYSDLRKATMLKTNLKWADLCGANLNGADLRGADLTKANLIEARLVNADLRDADLTGAHLTGTFLRGANLAGVKLNNTSLKSAIISENQVDYLQKMGYDLQGAKIFIENTGEMILYENWIDDKKIL